MLYTAHTLPLSKMVLTDWQLIHVTGEDSRQFLQGQLTADLTKLTASQFLFAAQCDPKGKVCSNMLLVQRNDQIYYIERQSVVQTQLAQLKKYAIFSKITFAVAGDLQMIGLAGDLAHPSLHGLTTLFDEGQNCLTVNGITYLKLALPTPRYLLIGTAADLEQLTILNACLLQTNAQWALLDIEANYPIIDQPTSNQYLPQAFNLQHMAAISFDKGCYCGQEMVARAQYRGINKRALYRLTGQSDLLPVIGETLEQQIAGNWRETGSVTAALRIDEQTIWVQAILNNDLADSTLFRVKNQPTSRLLIAPLQDA